MNMKIAVKHACRLSNLGGLPSLPPGCVECVDAGDKASIFFIDRPASAAGERICC